MANLIPTPIVDRNGKQTTVHKRLDKSSGPSAALSAAKPTLGNSRKSKASSVTKVKASQVRTLHEDSIIRNENFEWVAILNGEGEYSWRKEDREIPNATLYEYMRRGIDLSDAFVLEGLDVTPNKVDEHLSNLTPGRLGLYYDSQWKRKFPLKNQKVIDAMEAAGVPPLRAFKALENGIQDGHLEKLDLEHVLPIFQKWRYYGAEGSLPEQNSSRLIDAICKGDVPYELSSTNTRIELSRLESEMRYTNYNGPLKELLQEDRDLFIKIAERGLKGIPLKEFGTDIPMTKMLQLYQNHGEGVLELEHPTLLHYSVALGGPDDTRTMLTVEDAKYVESVGRMAVDNKDNVSLLWDEGDTGRGHRQTQTLSHHAIMRLKHRGASAEKAYELLVKSNLTEAQAMTVLEDGISSAISQGAL